MVEIVGIRFKKNCKTYYFAPGELKIEKGQHVIVETARGMELGEVVIGNRQVEDKQVLYPLKPVVRIADEKDIKTLEENQKRLRKPLKYAKRRLKSITLI